MDKCLCVCVCIRECDAVMKHDHQPTHLSSDDLIFSEENQVMFLTLHLQQEDLTQYNPLQYNSICQVVMCLSIIHS